MISPEIIEEIRQKADIVDVISNYIEVIKKGNSFLAVCPFHNDKNPSLQISRTKQIYKCFSCGSGGNVFTFVQDYEKVSFIEAVRKVAALIGFESEELDRPVRKVDDETKKILDALKKTNEIYAYLIHSQMGSEAEKYLEKRNIPEEMSRYFSLGFSPDGGDVSIKLLRGQNISIDTLDKAGILTRAGNQFLDRFRGRLIFPLYNEFGDVVGFSGRRIRDDADEAKYVNSLNTAVFNKSSVLYNYQNASKEAKREGCVYVTEGFMDVFSLYRIGVKSAVALMGTAFTAQHAKLLKKLNVEVRLCLDGDDAGQHGMLAMIETLDAEKIKYRVVNYRDCQLDPDEIFQKYGGEALKKFLQRLMTREEFVLAYFQKRIDLSTIAGKKEFSVQIIRYANSTGDAIDREFLLQKVSELTGISIETYRRMISNKPRESERFFDPIPETRMVKKYTSYQALLNGLIRLMLDSKRAAEDYKNKGNNYILDKTYSDLADYILDYYAERDSMDISDFITRLSDDETGASRALVNKVIELQDMRSDSVPEYSEKRMEEYIGKLKEKNEKIRNKKTYSNDNLEITQQEKVRRLAEFVRKKNKDSAGGN